jgi:hypothetical protein
MIPIFPPAAVKTAPAHLVDPRPDGDEGTLCAGRRAVGEQSDAVLRTAMARRSLRRAVELPAGRHDDQVDAIGLFGQLLDKMVRRRSRSRLSALRATGGMASGRPA